MQNKFRRVSSLEECQLRQWEEQLQEIVEKLSYISKFIHNKFTTAIESEFIIYDIDLQRWTLQILQEKIGNLNPTIYLKHFTVGYQQSKRPTELFRKKNYEICN